MVERYRDCVFALNPRASSIDTPLRAFVPAAHVDHTHPNAVIIAIAASERGEAVSREIYGDEVPWLPWMRPASNSGSSNACVAIIPMRGRGGWASTG